MKTFELLLADETDEVYAISLVEKGAIEKDFVWFGKEDIKFATADDEQRIVAGPLLIPDKKIIRVDGKGETYFVYFTADTIEKIAQRYMLRNYNSKATLEHSKAIEDVTLVESWVSKSRTADKASTYGFNLPAGTWYGLMKINNDDIWNNYVKSGVVNAFSIEGSFEHKQVAMTIQDDTFICELEEQEGIEMLGMIKRILKKDNRYKSKEKVEMESYSDYPDSVSNNAKRGIELNDKLGNKCATPVGKIRAQQLAQKKPLSVETIKRMYSYLSRAEAYYDENDMEACGTISFYLWGGLAGKSWAQSKLKELGEIEMSAVDLETSVGITSSYPGTFETSGSVDMEVGVPHYTKDGKLYEGPTHKDSEGRLMTGETHSEASEYLYHKEDLLTELEIEEGEVNPCQSGYIMIGFKDKDGRQVPNCVPEK